MSLFAEPGESGGGRKPLKLVGLVLVAVLAVTAAAVLIWQWGPGPPQPERRERVASETGAPKPEAPATSAMPAEPAPPAPVVRRPRRSRAAEPAPEPAAPVPEAPTTGTLRVTSDVEGAMVFLDREYLGTTPLVAERIATGSHRLNVSAEGFDGHAETIDVPAGPVDVTVRFKEVKLNETLAVVHKHRMGKCEGRLIATTSGLRYDTANRQDAFVMGLKDLEVFQVDYLEKNLRVRSRGGKTFNFTDPDGNADRLFTFHRSVEKARTLLGLPQLKPER